MNRYEFPVCTGISIDSILTNYDGVFSFPERKKIIYFLYLISDYYSNWDLCLFKEDKKIGSLLFSNFGSENAPDSLFFSISVKADTIHHVVVSGYNRLNVEIR